MNRFTTVIYPLAGFVLITIGAAWMYKPLGPIIAGVLLIAAALLGNRKS